MAVAARHGKAGALRGFRFRGTAARESMRIPARDAFAAAAGLSLAMTEG
uniref:Uncharacterized protein n=1 Tax=uncultured bacterium Contig575 TaxID=1393592 RepID=W0FNH4_9BACT|nr:hypothetical protein [uncultured bacterium Contig575]